MPRIIWSDAGSRSYQSGIDRGVLYVNDLPGVAWNGLTGVQETPTGGTATPYYVDGEQFLNCTTREVFEATITAYTYPDQFEVCDGSYAIRSGLNVLHQKRLPFGFSYRSMKGNDQSPTLGYKIHLVYNAKVAPSSWSHKSLADTAAIDDFSWKVTTIAPTIGGYRRSAHLVLDSTELDPLVLSGLETILYGDDSDPSRLPFLPEILDMIDTGNTLTIVDNGDGSYSATAPATDLFLNDVNSFQLEWPTVTIIDANSFTASSP